MLGRKKVLHQSRCMFQKMFILQCQFLTPSLLQVQCLERTLNTALPVKQVRQPSSSVIMNCPSMDVNVRDPRLQSCAVAHPHQQEEECCCCCWYSW
mmetsp:Transcript_6143/g.22480  ORF Transcript_6143/g.22480 Transcript_6143/m.22480 type:complete len:96 (+) Transcript_6143:387-674(+)